MKVTPDNQTSTAFARVDVYIFDRLVRNETMSMQLSIYVGPYLVLPKDFQWYDWANIVTNGRFEAGTDDEHLYLVPNVPLPGIDRQLLFDRGKDTPVLAIHGGHIVDELNALTALVDPLSVHCRVKGIQFYMQWGIVPCWS